MTWNFFHFLLFCLLWKFLLRGVSGALHLRLLDERFLLKKKTIFFSKTGPPSMIWIGGHEMKESSEVCLHPSGWISGPHPLLGPSGHVGQVDNHQRGCGKKTCIPWHVKGTPSGLKSKLTKILASAHRWGNSVQPSPLVSMRPPNGSMLTFCPPTGKCQSLFVHEEELFPALC